MLNELDFLKKDWKKQEKNFPQLSYDQIYKMLWKRSSSIVKWIFVISICELLLSTLLNIFLTDDAYWKEMEEIHLKNFLIGLYIVSYSITFFFIYQFYKNYKKISATDDASTLMKNILKTRRTVKTYIAYVLISTGISSLIIAYFTIKNHSVSAEIEKAGSYSYEILDWIKFILIGSIVLFIFLGIIWLFYRLIYGILLKKLHRNYKELQKLEV
ncbi:MAG TPA: hypothetical protein VFM59_08310 [Salinimicrobium sp.]|nr:hypothetical protein [Salinimicrobium sp.]